MTVLADTALPMAGTWGEMTGGAVLMARMNMRGKRLQTEGYTLRWTAL
jgi:hypothetical protein